MHVVVVAAGECPAAGQAARQSVMMSASMVIAADAGLAHCIDHDVWPDVVVGDFDSAPPELLDQARAKGIRLVGHPSDKDLTDLELAVDEAIASGATELTVIGALGGRIDHELANVGMLANPARRLVAIQLDDGVQQARIVHTAIELALPVDTTVSLIALGKDAIGVTAVGFRWPLSGATLTPFATLGISNEVVEPTQRVSLHAGVLLVVTAHR